MFTLTESHWPHLAGTTLVTSRFHPVALTEADFVRQGIPFPPGLQQAVPKRRAEFMAGRLCAGEALWKLSGQRQIPAMGPARAPCWPSGFTGSISHSDTHAAALVARSQDYDALGLDIEPCLTDEKATALIPALLTANEQARLTSPSSRLGYTVTLVFSLKESLYKALYPLTGRHFYFEDAEITALGNGRARLRLLTHLNEHWPAGTQVNALYCRHGEQLMTQVAIAADKGKRSVTHADQNDPHS
ncbi:4'-phosphopantetheinyl transferase superfamily protein [Oceanimonas baumannii]|uniref:4'-phosphopantetheinyl transferase family protein n=1 Tax=Oceanimonas baumannii TaxID=129578 RepID=UPI001D192E34|nr:4'-phosphopantetheinyl transferase superfamily protein [Oceanimonas baumannii]MCC4264135.1 4'-phosphopantetheinyl transferase superfamily protein [Oceanimonas baumannii]